MKINFKFKPPDFKAFKAFPGALPQVFPQLATKDIVSFNLSSDYVKLVYGRISPAKTEIKDLLILQAPGLADEEISQLIRSSLDKFRLGSPQAINVIPAHLTVTKVIEIPSKDPQEIREILELQAGRHTPYSQEEIIVDYLIINTFKDCYTKVILVIVPLNVVRRQIAILDAAGLRITTVVFAPEALAQICSKMLNWPAKTVHTLIHLDLNFTGFINICDGNVFYVRNIPIGTQHLTSEKERYETRFVEEVKKSLETYEGENIDKTPEEFILTGAYGQTHALQPVLAQALNRPVKTFDYGNFISLASESLKDTSNFETTSFLDVVAPLLTTTPLKINLIPADIKLRKSFEQKGKDLMETGILVLGIFTLICAILASRVAFKYLYIKSLNNKYADVVQKAKVLEGDFSGMQLIDAFHKDHAVPLEVLTELYRLIPADVRLSDIKYGPQNKFVIGGNARTMATVFSFISAMEESKHFAKVEPKRTTKNKEGTEETVEFEIVSQIEERN